MVFWKKIGEWIPKTVNLLYDSGNPIWVEHPKGQEVDVIALPIEYHNDIQVFPIDLSLANNLLRTYPSKAVSIIGFPQGITASGKFPIWKKGHIASDIAINFDNKPIFLIDATTRNGMSGSPVILKESGMCEFENRAIAQGNYKRFLGVYSGRIDDHTEIGRVWKAHVIEEIISKV